MKHVHIYNLDGEDRRLVDLVQMLLDPLKSQATDLSVWFGVVKGRDMSDLLAQREAYDNKKKKKISLGCKNNNLHHLLKLISSCIYVSHSVSEERESEEIGN